MLHLCSQWKNVALAGACAGVGYTATLYYRNDQEAYHLLQTVPRTFRLLSWAATSYFRYQKELAAEGGAKLSQDVFSSLQRENARDLSQVCRQNGGIFIKAAHFASNLATVPVEYREEFGALKENDCVLPESTVLSMIERELGRPLSAVFQSLSPEPVATASLAQVHKGVLLDGREVAVKVQYPGVGYAAAADLRVCSWVASALSAFGFPGVAPVQRVLQSLVSRIQKEVDLTLELENCNQLKSLLTTPRVAVPESLPSLSSHKVLVMEWIDGVPVTDVQAMRHRGIDPKAVGNALLHAFADMVYVQGRMHGDLHAANVLVRGSGSDFQVVLLDHGWHVNIPDKLRRQYCQLWCAFVLHDNDAAENVAEEISGPSARHIVPVVLQIASGGRKQKNGNSKDGLSVLGGLQHVEAISLLPLALVEILRSFQTVRSLVMPLGLTSGDRLKVNCGYALQGLTIPEDSGKTFRGLHVAMWRWPWQGSAQKWKEWRLSVRLSARITLLRALLWARSTKDSLVSCLTPVRAKL